MFEPYLGEIRMFAGLFAPVGWEFCDGQLLPIAQNETLFALIRTTYGGDGQTTFALPDLRSRVPMHLDGGMPLGSAGGVESVTLTQAHLPVHSHVMRVTNAGHTQAAANALIATATSGQSGLRTYTATATGSLTSVHPASVTPAGGGRPHENRQPFTAVNFIIAMQGIYPSSA